MKFFAVLKVRGETDRDRETEKDKESYSGWREREKERYRDGVRDTETQRETER
jgi:hypothetical protein